MTITEVLTSIQPVTTTLTHFTNPTVTVSKAHYPTAFLKSVKSTLCQEYLDELIEKHQKSQNRLDTIEESVATTTERLILNRF